MDLDPGSCGGLELGLKIGPVKTSISHSSQFRPAHRIHASSANSRQPQFPHHPPKTTLSAASRLHPASCRQDSENSRTRTANKASSGGRMRDRRRVVTERVTIFAGIAARADCGWVTPKLDTFTRYVGRTASERGN